MIRAIDLFCGIGGNSWGARDAGVQIVAGFDIWKLAGEVYKDNFPEASFYRRKIQNIKINQIKEKLGKIDLIIASPECTSHSVARGNREKNDESLKLANQVLRFAKVFQPRWIVIENVVSMKRWDDYPNFLRKLGRDYKYLEQRLVASDFGVPQSRRRLYIICDREQQPSSVVIPEDAHTKLASDVVNMNGLYSFSPLVTKGRAKATIERAKRAFKVIGKEQPFLMVYYGSDAAGGWQSLHVPLRTVTTLDRFALIKPIEGGKKHVMRMLQPPELQAAMGIPPEFKLDHGTRRDKIHLLGNAVCPPVMKAIIESLIR
jgi:DNA (cytosine-5)-methyltransferase 1